MTVEQLQTNLTALKQQALLIEGGIQTLAQLIQLEERAVADAAALAAEVKD